MTGDVLYFTTAEIILARQVTGIGIIQYPFCTSTLYKKTNRPFTTNTIKGYINGPVVIHDLITIFFNIWNLAIEGFRYKGSYLLVELLLKNVGVFFGNLILGTDNLLLGIFQIIKSSKAEHFSIMFSPFNFAISLLISNFSIVYQLKILMQR